MTEKEKLDIAAKALKHNGFDPVICVEKAANAIPVILDWIERDAWLEMAGSVSVRQLGLLDLLRERGNPGLDFPAPREEDPARGRRDVLLVSANALTLDGKIVNLDGMGNRVAAMAYGMRRVILIVGANKIVADIDEALDRVQNVIAPYHAKCLGVDTPCARTGTCSDCNSPQRICNVTTIITRRPPRAHFSIILTAEDLGLGWDPAWPAERIERIKTSYRVEIDKFRAALAPARPGASD
ncbi:MAG: lactate utilization protein [Acidobacteriota bacterium]|jgi:hypothetical protein|nr:lactate utilization protein [Acidobacteriota bacterium]NLT33892.1 LUD domain-containing protein [Acidobacteriota bacterium]